MTRAELRKYYEQKNKLNELEETRRGLVEYYEDLARSDPTNKILQRLSEDIERLDREIAAIENKLNGKEQEVQLTLSRLSDIRARTAAMLHYYEGFPWDMVAAILKGTDTVFKAAVYRGMKKAGIE